MQGDWLRSAEDADGVPVLVLQLTVRAYDLSVPRAESPQFATVRINVIRNDNCPVFGNLPNDVTISQTSLPSSIVYSVSATDNDPTVSYSLTSLLSDLCHELTMV